MERRGVKMLTMIECLSIMLLSALRGAESLEFSAEDASNLTDYSMGQSGMNKSNCTNRLCISDEKFLDLIAEEIVPDLREWFLIAMHTVVFVVGLVGNFLVCLAVYRNHSMRTVTNYFIVNLAVADLLVILFCLPSSVLWDVTETWFLGLRLCKAVLYIQMVSVTVSIMTLTFISIDRWYAICFPLRFKSTTSRAKKAIFVIWLVAFLFDIPQLVVLQLVPATHLEVETVLFTQCAPSWSSQSQRTFTFLTLVLLYFGPLIFMTVTYYQIVRVLWTNDIPGHILSARVCQVNVNPSAGLGNPEGQLKSRRKAAKMLVAVVVMFGICYLPVHVLTIMREAVDMESNGLNRTFSLLAHWLCYANSAVNPIIYNFMSGKFRKEFKRTFCCPGGSASLNHGRVAYTFAGSNLSGQRSQMLTRSVRTTINNNTVQQSVEIVPLSAISNVQQNDKHN